MVNVNALATDGQAGSGSQPVVPSRRAVVAIAVLIVAYGLALASYSREGFPGSMFYGSGMPYLSDAPVGDDGYLMLTVAWHFAEEGKLVYDLDKPTTGIQPLATFLYAGIARLVQAFGGDKWLFVRWVIVANILLLIALTHQIGLISQAIWRNDFDQRIAYRFGFILAATSFSTFRLFTFGLETGLYLVLAAALVVVTLQRDLPLQPAKVGLLGGLAGLARIDYGVVFGLLLLGTIAKKRLNWRGALLAGGIALLITAPWILWVHDKSGSWMPSSGSAEGLLFSSDDVTLRVRWMLEAVIWNLTPALYFFDSGLRVLPLSSAIILLSASLFGAVVLWRQVREQIDRQACRELLNWCLRFSALIPIYALLFGAWYFYSRYTALLILVSIPATAALCTMMARRVRFFSLALPPMLLLLFVGFAAMTLHSGRMALDLPVNAGFVHDHMNAQRVGALQSGVVGFYNENVVNLDGKIDFQALNASRNGASGILDYISAEHVDALVDWPALLTARLGQDALQEGWQLCPMQPSGSSRCFKRR